MSEAQQNPQGWKTNTVSALAIAGGLAGYFLDVLTAGECALLVAMGLVGFGLRDAIAKVIADRAATAVDRAKKKLAKPPVQAEPK